MSVYKIGVLAFQGDVIEHISALKNAIINLSKTKQIKSNEYEVTEVRTKQELEELTALIIPGGESTTIQKLCERENTFESMKKIPNIFGTCAGAIMLAKQIENKESDQRSLELMNIKIARNSYGRQIESFETQIELLLDQKLQKINAVFIRAPKIISAAKNVKILVKTQKDGILLCEQSTKDKFYLAASFHPELETTIVHEYFLKNLILSND